MFFDEIIYGTQYYRAPTPLPEEWEKDIPELESYSLDTFQIRINWRWNEVREGEYRFDDVDRLFELAEKHGKRVIVKFLLECAPQYVFDKYGGTRIGPRGEQLRGGSHGAFYGGWRPCFTNPDVAKRASLFCEEVAKRYKDRPSLILWNAWNEIRNKPIEDCYCPHCRAAYGEYLRKRFGTIDALNEFYGTAEDSFEAIALPSTPHGFWDTFEYKSFTGGENLYSFLKIVYDAVRRHDTLHPIMSHVGFTSAFQYTLGDVCNDYRVKEAVDFWGTSIPCACNMDTADNRLDFMLLNDYLYSLDKSYFLHEIYPGLGMFKYTYDTPFDMKFKLHTALSSGAKGLVFWQYRAERVGHENDCAGIVRADGSPREVAFTVGAFGRELKDNARLFAGASVNTPELAIVYDFNSQLLSEIEDTCGPDFHFETFRPVYYYKNSHMGAYRLFRESDYDATYIDAHAESGFEKYKLLYLPYHNMLDEKTAKRLMEYVKNGGTVIADEGFGLRNMNTWLNPYDLPIKPMATVRMRERRLNRDTGVVIDGERISASPYKTEYRVEGASVVLRFDDGTPAAQAIEYGKGKIYFLGFSLGYTYYEKRYPSLRGFTEKILSEAGVEKARLSDVKAGLYVKRLTAGEDEILFVSNCTGGERTLSLPKDAVLLGGDGRLEGGCYTLGDCEMGYVKYKT
ncbi:MAG: beta-galactosidase [Clostridia bacterium]|nr:beta-galactosidase [Clostridia bacterium]